MMTNIDLLLWLKLLKKLKNRIYLSKVPDSNQV